MKTQWMALSAAVVLVAAGATQARPRFAKVEGPITAVSVAPSPQTVTIGSVTLNVTPQTKIQVGEDERGTFADLDAGLVADAKYERSSLNALMIKVAEDESEIESRGVVLTASFDTALGTGSLGLDTNNDTVADVTLVLDAQTELKLGRLVLTPDQIALLVGRTVEVEYNSTTFLASKVSAELEDEDVLTARGTVSAVDAVAGTLTVETATGPITFTVPAIADIRVNGRSLPLSSIVVGDPVTVRYVTGGTAPSVTNIALSVSVSGASVRPQNVQGTLTDVDAVAGTLTITTRGGETLVLTVGPSSDVRVNGRRLTLAQLETALDAATAAGRSVKIQAQYFQRGLVNLVIKAHANVNSRGGGRR